MSYDDFLKSKQFKNVIDGFDATELIKPLALYDFQKAIVRWALKKGKAAIFADTGMGKTFMQLAWSYCVHQHDGGAVLIVAPLCVSRQTIQEAKKLDIRFANGPEIQYVIETPKTTGIYCTNYERLKDIDLNFFSGLVLDESSILKHQNSKIRMQIILKSKKL